MRIGPRSHSHLRSSLPITCPFSRTRRIIFIRLLVRRRMVRRGWRRFSLLAYVFFFFFFRCYPIPLLIFFFQSYVLHQERNVLFNPKPDATAALARSGTRKTSSAAAHRPAVAQPLVPLLPLFASSTQSLPQNDVFEPGSLLSKQP